VLGLLGRELITWIVAVDEAAVSAAVAPETMTRHRRSRREQGLGKAMVLVVPLLPALTQTGRCLALMPMPVLHCFQS